MKKLLSLLLVIMQTAGFVIAQQQVTVVSKCGGVDTVTIPSIADTDLDGMDDALEQVLIDHFMPVFIEYDNESCPGPALDGTGDSNLVVCHIYALPQQYAFSNNLDSVLAHPVAVVPKKGLVSGLIWYEPLIKVNAALLYGKDCGLAGHTADVEGFNYSIRYIGPDTAAGWMYDTVMQHWMGGTIQTISHEGTLCEQIETYPYRSVLFPAGKDTVLCSPDKHGNYLTKGGCGASFICNPGCGGVPMHKNVRGVNLGEPSAPLITDLGTAYAQYAGNDPWGTAKFLATDGGNAGVLTAKMILPLTDDFITGAVLTSQAQICAIYGQCFGTGSVQSVNVCGAQPYQFYGQPLTVSGTYYHTAISSYGCDSTVQLNFTRLPASSSAQSVSVCSSYNFNGNELTASGVYRDTLTSINGCDSVVTLSLIINQPEFHEQTAVICRNSVYQFNDMPLSNAGVYYDTLTTTGGCDNIIQLRLSIDTLPAVTLALDNDTLLADNHDVLLSGGTPAGGIYFGPGVSGNVFSLDIAGEGVHTISYVYTDSLGCNDTATAQIIIIATGINDVEGYTKVHVYPNPASDRLNVTAPVGTVITIFNTTGEEVKRMVALKNTETISLFGIPAGIYMLQVIGLEFITTRKLIVQ